MKDHHIVKVPNTEANDYKELLFNGITLMIAGALAKGGDVVGSKVGKAGNSALGKVGQAVSNFGSKMGGTDYTSGGIGSNLKFMGDYLQASSMSRRENAQFGNQKSSRLSRFGSGMMNAGKESMAQAMSNVKISHHKYIC